MYTVCSDWNVRIPLKVNHHVHRMQRLECKNTFENKPSWTQNAVIGM